MLFSYQSTNPCNCSTSSNPSDPPCEDTCNCLNLCTITIPSNSDDAVVPCTGELILNVESPEYDHDLCACGADAHTWSVAYFDSEVFDSVTVSNTGDLNATPIATPPGVYHSNIILKFACGNISAYLTIVVGIQDMCSGVICDEGEVCDECTGDCEPINDIGTE